MLIPNSAAFTHIIKRDGGIKPFDADKIAHALTRAAQATLEFDAAEAHLITHQRVLPRIHASGQVREDMLDERGIFHETENRYTHRLHSIRNII